MSYAWVRVSLAWVGGLGIGEAAGHAAPLWLWTAAAAGGFVVFVVLRRLPIARRAALLMAVAALGVLRVAVEPTFPDWLERRAPWLDRIEARIVSYPSFGQDVVRFTVLPRGIPGRLEVSWYRDVPLDAGIGFGDRVQLSGSIRLPQPFDGFDYPTYLARRGVFATMSAGEEGVERLGPGASSLVRWGDRMRQTIMRRFDRRLAPDVSAVARSLLFGDRAVLPAPIEEAFSKTGLMHLLAVSGLHLGVFLAGAWWAARWIGLRPRWAYPAVGVLVVVALWVVGPRVSLIRAALLFGFLALGSVLADLGLLLRRTVRPINGLAAAAVVVLAMRPGALHDAGFQLTFAATAAILVAFSPPLDVHRRIRRYAERCGAFHRPAQYLLTLLAASAAAQAGAAPVLAWHFEAIHPLALAANLVALPLAGAGLWCGLAAALASGSCLFPYAAAPLHGVMTALTAIVEALAGIEIVQLRVEPWMGVWLAALVAYTLSLAAYRSVGSSWTWNSTSIVSGSWGGGWGIRRRRKNLATSTTPTTSLNSPGSNSSRPPKNSNPSD